MVAVGQSPETQRTMDFKLTDHTILLVTAGSRCYGVHRPGSDVDVKGICIPPRRYYLGVFPKFAQADGASEIAAFLPIMTKEEQQVTADTKLEGSVYELRKFMELAAQANPNILDVLFCREKEVRVCTPQGRLLRENRDLFISQKAKWTFTGYATAQLKRIQTHRRWLTNPPTHKPTRAEYGLPEMTLIPKDQLAAAWAAIQKRMDEWEMDFGDMGEAEKIHIQDRIAAYLSEVTIGSDERWKAAGRLIGYDENLMAILERERKYKAALTEWDQYENWRKTRNVARAELEARYGYDCYLDDTEFLTDHGWKRYDDVTAEDRLGTFNRRTNRIEYQWYTERVAKPYTGKISLLTSRHSNCAVTLNHRMWVSPVHRSAANGFSCDYDPMGAKWGIHPLHELVKGSRSYFHVRRAAEGDPDDQDDVTDEYLILMGAYVSEGCVGKRLVDKSASVLRISQKDGNRLCPYMEQLAVALPDAVRKFEGVHDEEWRAEPCTEIVWTVAHREWASRLDEECGSGSTNKRLPLWTRGLGIRQVRLLLDVMLAGDGTPHGDGWVYYTASKRLADDVQAMCVSSGIVSAVWGPYPDKRTSNSMYQVFIGRDQSPVAAVCLREDGSQSFEIVDVSDARIVCFTVPNEILVTRRNGQVAIQGNTKHGAHLVRLLRMGREILETGAVNVWRGDIDADEIVSIRNGSWSYDRLIEWAEEQNAYLDEYYKSGKSPLPKTPDHKGIDALCEQMLSASLR